MNSTRLATFTQISDLHFGDISTKGEIVYDRGMKLLWTLLPTFAGLAGHEPQALRDLVTCVEQIRVEDGRAKLLLTGDLTSTGKKSQDDIVAAFMGSELAPPLGNFIGLNEPDWRERAIPGNHDHWPGFYSTIGPLRSHLIQWTNTFPKFQQSTISLGDTGVTLRFLAINTDSDVWEWGADRLLARGHFLSQLRLLFERMKDLLPHHTKNEVRVLMLHHSLLYRGPRGGLPARPLARVARRMLAGLRRARAVLEIDRESRVELRRFLARFDIPIILTGHTHRTKVGFFLASSPFPARLIPCLEACCGTTTQANHVPCGWPSHDRSRTLEANSLLVHRLDWEHGRILWKTQSWGRLPSEGFVPVAEPPVEFPVWPRPAR